MKSLILITLVALCLGASGCQEDCGVTTEPLINLNFVNMATPKFTRIILQGSIKDIPNSGADRSINDGQFGNMYLPLNLNANNTTYIFEQANRKDTLTIYYRVVIKNISLACGNILDIDSTSIKPKTTFKKVDISYGTYYGQKNFFGYTGQIGLTVNITEL